MAMNLRLSADIEDALRRESRRTGRSQQDVIREAVSRHLGLTAGERPRSELGILISAGSVRPPRMPYRAATDRLRLDVGETTQDLLDRDDRL